MKERTRIYSRYHRTTPAERAHWVQQFQASGLSQQAFAARYGMGFSTLGKWLQKENAPPGFHNADSPRWQEVILPAASSQGWAAEIAFKDGPILRLSAATANAMLGSWLNSRS